jgi:hypothetical protein
MGLLNHSTTISPEQTIAEIQAMLIKHDISGMMTEYEGRQVKSVSFRMEIEGQTRAFRIPCNWRAVHEILKQDRRLVGKEKNEEQAIRVAWRIIHTWVKSQLAMVEVNLVTVPQIFLPYTIMRDGRTLTETVESNPQLLLG